jgi:hypothetical protein
MPNLVQLSNELEYVPKEQLAQMSQDPSSRFPQYLVLSEIQRRTANEKAYAAAKPQPTTTVAEEVVGEFMQPKGLQAGMPSESAPTDAFSSESMGIPASAPMQQPMIGMAKGGLTEYMEEVNSELKRIKEKESRYAARNKKQEEGKTIFSSSLSPRNYVIPNEEYKKLTDKGMVRAFDAYRPMGLLFNALSGEGAFSGMDRTIPESKLKNLESAMKQSRNEMRQRQQGLASGGLTAFAAGDRTSLDETFYNPITNVGSSTNPYPVDDEVSFLEDRYIDEEGNIRYGRALGDASLLIPIGAGLNVAGRLGLAGLRKFAPNILQKTKGLFTSPNPALASLKTGQRKVKTDKGYDTINTATGKKIPEQLFDAKKSLTAVSYPAAAATLISRSADDEETTKPTNTETEAERKLRLENEAYKKQLDALRNKATGVSKPKKEIDYDLVGLGGLIMGSKNLSDLGMGLAGLAESKQNRQAAKEKLDLERQLTEAQVMSLKDKSKYSDTEALQSYLTAKKKQISEQLDSGLLTQELAAKELEKLAPAEARLIQMYEILFGGIGNTTNSDDAFMNRLSA